MRIYILSGAFAAAVLDQASKRIMLAYFPERVTFNSGIAFGLPVPELVLLVGIPLLLVGFLYWVLSQKRTPDYFLLSILYALILGGGFSNYFDRVFRGSVVDFINIGFWPSFNFADSFLTIGIIGLIIHSLKNE